MEFGLTNTNIGNEVDEKLRNPRIVNGSVGSKSPATMDSAANYIGAGFDPVAAKGEEIELANSMAGKDRINFPFMGG